MNPEFTQYSMKLVNSSFHGEYGGMETDFLS
jgi:hypothetical protein